MQAVRPRGFVSNLLLNISAVLDRKFGSSELIRLLSSLGLCASYDETQMLIASILLNKKQPLITHGYSQMMADNADWNTHTSTGYGTFHSMDIIMSVAPYTTVETDYRIERLSKFPDTTALSKFGHYEVQKYDPLANSIVALSNIEFKDLKKLNDIDMNVSVRKPEFLWLFAKYKKKFRYTGWNSFMEEIHEGEKYILSRLIPLTFIMAYATDLDTIYKVLNEAHLKCIQLKQRHIFVTFDLPLYIKSVQIKASYPHLENVIIRLGGFHWLMSFMGCIDPIMQGSGLQELLNTVFALGSIEKIVNGHA